MVTAATVLAGVGLTVLTMSQNPTAEAATTSAQSVFDVAGRGASVPFLEQEAELAATNGSVIGPDRTYTTLPSEASGRKAVKLDQSGEYVEFTLTEPANALTVRYSVPDSASGSGLTAPIDLKVNGTTLKTLSLTSKYSWFYGGYPFSNDPGAGNQHHFYDETRTMLGSTLPAGSKVRFQVTSTSVASWFVIDLADFEVVPEPLTQPAGSLSVTDFGADASGGADSTAAIQAAVNAGRDANRVVWIPRGTFKVTDHIIVDRVSLQGAGQWYTVLTGRNSGDLSKGVGIYGKYVADGGPSQNVTVSDLAIMGEVVERDDNWQVNAFGGAMSNSTIARVWMQHTKVGAWMDGPMDRFTITDCRILDQTADGVNFHIGVTNSTVKQTFVRNSGDDGLAMWAENTTNANNSFVFNTVVLPILANNIAIYGGRDITVSDNVLADTITNGGAIHIANRYPGVNAGAGTAVSGTHTVARNTTLRAGNSDYNWQFGVGAIWFDALNGPISDATINVTDTDLIDSSYQAIGFIEGTITGINFKNVNIMGAGTFALQLQTGGSASFTNVVATGIGHSNPMYSCQGAGAFAITQGAGNSGWYTASPYCGPWPTPVYGNPTTPPTTTPPTTVPPTSVPPTTAPPTPGGNLALGRPATATSHTDVYQAGNALDGNSSTYWESVNNAFPQSLTVDLGTTRQIARVVFKLPPVAAWGARTQTVALLGSSDGSRYSTIAGPAGYSFDPAKGNSVTVTFTATTQRYLRLTFTANTSWPAGQLSEFEVYAN
jgi:hypothetical protein